MNLFKKMFAGLTALFGLMFAGLASALDTTAVQTSLTAAQTDGEAVGVMVIGVVAALVVVGIVISLVRKA